MLSLVFPFYAVQVRAGLQAATHLFRKTFHRRVQCWVVPGPRLTVSVTQHRAVSCQLTVSVRQHRAVSSQADSVRQHRAVSSQLVAVFSPFGVMLQVT